VTAEGHARPKSLNVSVRKMALEDVSAVSRILEESPEAVMWSEDSLRESASVGLDGWVAELDGVVAGFLIGRRAADEFEILNLGVSRKVRRSGIASRLLESTMESARLAGTKCIHLEVRASNTPAIALYTLYGFAESGRRFRYYRDPVEDAILLSSDINGTRK
jgi:[ribosomal protein S18]-alanine N-acetyltransferase